MATGGFDWVAVFGILGTLSGVTVGAWGTWKIQERNIQYSDESRFQEERLAAYLDFLNATNMAVAAIRNGLDYTEALEVVVA
jgi:ABC-type lipoprotein release transport system permease subunit